MAPLGLISKSEGSSIPLKSIEIHSKVHGYTAEVVATMEYENNRDIPIEAVYVFPIDEEAAVCGFQATIEGRTIVAEIQEKQEARDTYDDAISSGHSAYLLEESDESSDIFQISVGNLAPHKTAKVQITFVTELAVEKEGGIVFVLPTVLNPRYTPMDSQHTGSVSTTMPTIASVSTKYAFDFELDVQCASAIREITSPSNRLRVDINPEDDRQARVLLDEEYKFNVDLQVHILSCQPRSPHALVENGVTKTKDGRESNDFLAKPVVMLNFFPEFDISASLERGEFLFVIDRSGSMNGAKIRSARETLLLFLKSLPDSCYFNVIGFGSSFQKLFTKSEVYSDSSVDVACSHAQSMQADLGGTEILRPLQDVFSEPLIKGYPRQVFLLTDGEVGNTQQVIDLVARNAFKLRCFSFGIGEGASTALVKGVARAGRGTAEFVYSEDRLQPKVIKTLKSALQPAVKDVQVTWTLPKDWEVEDVPTASPTLFAGNRFVSFGIFNRRDQSKYNNRQIVAIEGTATLTGHVDEGPNPSLIRHVIKFSAVCGNPGDTSVMLHRLCAKAAIQEKQNRCEGDIKNASDIIKLPIINLSKSTNIVSKLTSFVAVDEDSREPVSRAMERPVMPIQDDCGRVFALCSMNAGFGYGMSQPMIGSGSFPQHMIGGGGFPQPMIGGGRFPQPMIGGGGFPQPMIGGGRFPPPMMGGASFKTAQQGIGFFSADSAPPPPGKASHYASVTPPPPPPPPRESSKVVGRKTLGHLKHKYGATPSARISSDGDVDSHIVLISMQKACGSWQPTTQLASICGVTLDTLKKACPKELTQDNRESMWATALALSCLFEKFENKKDEWEMVAAKGIKWLKANLSSDNHSYIWIMDIASEFLKL
ncbi:von Willebrand factor A domain-containing protein 5A-like [Actinia tenebrosa]|uniref:von Willebrand factor A domain-containing protein 5A-like n=1 Tax=Actinia tenebrosa TaxID=6105 RepID=A0A6P8IY95_ACTTE|nr:von Willebrand factor A domain-containing protein 5A-like [Actinia tenebrosa]